jgi:hypothetical protein
MCKPDFYIKLCTCDEEKIDKERCWRLIRQELPTAVLGLVVAQPMFAVENYVKQKILHDINHTKAFDFQYSPLEGDLLELNYGGYYFSYEFKDGQFEDQPFGDYFTDNVGIAKGNIYSGET